MYYSEENNHSSHLFHSMIQLARGLGVSNPNHPVINTNPETTNNPSPECNYSPIQSMPWPNPIEIETDYHQRRKHLGSSLQLLHQIPLDPTFNEVGRYFSSHVELHPDFMTPSGGIATHSGDSSVLPYSNHRNGHYSNVKFPLHQDSHTEFVDTCQSLTHLKHSDYEDEINTNRSSKLFQSTNQNQMRDEPTRDMGKHNTGADEFNLTFPSMYTFRNRLDMDTDNHDSGGACISLDNIEPRYIPQADKHSELLNTLTPKSNRLSMNPLSQYNPNLTITQTTVTNTSTLTNNLVDNSFLNNEYDQKFSYHSTKHLNSDTTSSESKLGITNNTSEAFNSYYSNSIDSPPKSSTIKWWSQDNQNDKLNPFRRIWNQDSVEQLIPNSTEPETHSLVAFAELFKQKRIKLGATQAEVGRALGDLNYGGFGCLSQSTICRFESLSLSQNNMLALKPILQAWLEQAEKRILNSQTRFDPRDHLGEPDLRNSYGNQGKDDLDDDTNSMLDYTFERKRKRTSITGPEKRSLEAYFAIQPRPSSDQLKIISNKLKLPKSVVRVWFCNQRQKQKRLQTVNHSCNGTPVMNGTSDPMCGLCKTTSSSPPSSFSPSYPIIHNQWNMTGK